MKVERKALQNDRDECDVGMCFAHNGKALVWVLSIVRGKLALAELLGSFVTLGLAATSPSSLVVRHPF